MYDVAHLIDSVSRVPYVEIRAPKSWAELQTPQALKKSECFQWNEKNFEIEKEGVETRDNSLQEYLAVVPIQAICSYLLREESLRWLRWHLPCWENSRPDTFVLRKS